MSYGSYSDNRDFGDEAQESTRPGLEGSDQPYRSPTNPVDIAHAAGAYDLRPGDLNLDALMQGHRQGMQPQASLDYAQSQSEGTNPLDRFLKKNMLDPILGLFGGQIERGVQRGRPGYRNSMNLAKFPASMADSVLMGPGLFGPTSDKGPVSLLAGLGSEYTTHKSFTPQSEMRGMNEARAQTRRTARSSDNNPTSRLTPSNRRRLQGLMASQDPRAQGIIDQLGGREHLAGLIA